jgi:hypothetical protein
MPGIQGGSSQRYRRRLWYVGPRAAREWDHRQRPRTCARARGTASEGGAGGGGTGQVRAGQDGTGPGRTGPGRTRVGRGRRRTGGPRTGGTRPGRSRGGTGLSAARRDAPGPGKWPSDGRPTCAGATTRAAPAIPGRGARAATAGHSYGPRAGAAAAGRGARAAPRGDGPSHRRHSGHRRRPRRRCDNGRPARTRASRCRPVRQVHPWLRHGTGGAAGHDLAGRLHDGRRRPGRG